MKSSNFHICLAVTIAILFVSDHKAHAQWAQTNGPFGGRVVCTAVSGTDLYAGTNESGVFRSTDGGSQWIAVNTGLTNKAIRAFTVSGSNIFAGTNGGGVFRSTDNGTSWTAVNAGLFHLAIWDLAVFGTDLYAAAIGDIYRSTDLGANWSVANDGLQGGQIRTLIACGGELIGGTVNEAVYTLNNNSHRWKKTSVGMTRWYTSVFAFGVCGTYLFAGTSDGMYRSSDNGQHWDRANASIIATTFTTDGTSIFAGTSGGGVYRSADNGGSWIESNAGLTNRFVRALAYSGSNLYAGTNGGGMFLSSDLGMNWVAANDGLNANGIGGLAASGSNLIAGAWNGTFYSTNEGGTWILSTGLESAATCFAVNATGLFAGAGLSGVFLSTDDGASWTARNTGLSNYEVRALIAKGSKLFAGAGAGLFASLDDGLHWASIGLPQHKITDFAVSGGNLFAATGSSVSLPPSEGVLVSTDDGSSWTVVNSGLTNTDVRDLAVVGTDIYAATAGGVFVKPISGTTWNSINTGLTNTNVNAIAVDGTDLFAGTFGGGIYYSTDAGANWIGVNSGLTKKLIQKLLVHNSQLFAATFGSGVWKRPLTDFPKLSSRENIPLHFSLDQNVPNPFNPTTTISYTIPTDGFVHLQVYDAHGRVVSELDHGMRTAGDHRSMFDARSLPSGTYFCRLEANGRLLIRTMMLLK